MDTTKPPRRALALALGLSLLIATLLWKPGLTQSAQSATAPTSAVHLALITKPGNPSGATPQPTVTETPSATPSATAQPTATATATATPILLRNCDNVYPIRIGAGLLGEQGFLPPPNASELPYYQIYNDPIYGALTQRRVYLKDVYSFLNFGFVRWRTDITSGNMVALTAALTGTGTLEQGFDEVVPWPDTTMPAPADYPQRPHRLNSGDWIYNNSGATISTAVKQTLSYHQLQHTLLTLPIVGYPVNWGNSGAVQLQRFGDFFLIGFGGSAGSEYLDLAFVGNSNPVPCTTG